MVYSIRDYKYIYTLSLALPLEGEEKNTTLSSILKLHALNWTARSPGRGRKFYSSLL